MLPPDPSQKSYDAIVIGSGIGGMTTATLLAKSRKKVLLLERHTVAGGFAHTFKRRGFEWDVGVHYVGQMDAKFSILRRVFDYVTDRSLQWASLGDVYDVSKIEGRRFEFPSDPKKLEDSLITKFPAEERAIRDYFKLVRAAASSGPWFFGEKTMPRLLSRVLGRYLRRRFESYAARTTEDVLDSLTQNQDLKAILLTQCGDYGLSPERSSFAIHAVVVAHYLLGASYPVGGAGAIAEKMLTVFYKHGGELRVKSEVIKILTHASRVSGVQLSTGEVIQAPIVISNAGFRNTFQKLVGPNDLPLKDRTAIQHALREVAPSTAHLCLYLGLKGSDEELGLPKHNIWLYDSSRMTEENKGSLSYISFPSAKDPAWSATHPGKSTIQIIRAANVEDVRPWAQEKWPRRSPDYLALKLKWSNELKEKLFGELPHLRDKIEVEELSTPLSTIHFSNYASGEIYGLEHTPTRFASEYLRPQSPIKGLILCGQDIVTVGVGGALYSGVLAATVALKKSMILRILLAGRR